MAASIQPQTKPPWATPPVVAIVVWRWILDPRVGAANQLLMWLGLIDQPIPFLADANWVWPSIIVIITWNTLPLVTLTFMASLQSLPGELVEAAEIEPRRATAAAAIERRMGELHFCEMPVGSCGVLLVRSPLEVSYGPAVSPTS